MRVRGYSMIMSWDNMYFVFVPLEEKRNGCQGCCFEPDAIDCEDVYCKGGIWEEIK